jgi:hypothetical protein
MSIQTWPTSLPRPERKSWQRSSQDARLKRQPMAGAPSYRSKYSRAAELVVLSVVLDRNQKAIFDNFHRYDCSDGVALFWMPDPTTDGWPLLHSNGTPLLTSEGLPLLMSKKWLCAWGDEMPVESIIGQVQFRKSFSIVVVP